MSALSHKMRGAAERFIADKARIAGILNSLKNDPLCVCVCVYKDGTQTNNPIKQDLDTKSQFKDY